MRVVLPNVKPGLVSTAFFCYVFSWNELLFSTILGGANTTKLIVPIAAYVSLAPIHKLWPVMGAMTLAYAAPCIIGSIILRKYLIRGMALGAVKG
jgi:multiple sugar transport system permease protein